MGSTRALMYPDSSNCSQIGLPAAVVFPSSIPAHKARVFGEVFMPTLWYLNSSYKLLVDVEELVSFSSAFLVRGRRRWKWFRDMASMKSVIIFKGSLCIDLVFVACATEGIGWIL